MILGSILCFLAGGALGGLFFWGLRLTTRRIPSATRPGCLLAGSFVVRLAMVALGFFLLLRLGASCLLVALLGFLLVRFILVRQWGVRPEAEGAAGGEDPESGKEI